MINYVAAGKTSFFPYFRLGLGARGEEEEVYWYNPAGIVITPMIIFMDRQMRICHQIVVSHVRTSGNSSSNKSG